MRRLAGGGAAFVAVLAVVVLGLGASGGSGGGSYLVRAIFDNAGYAAPGEQVRIAGAPVGSIVSESVTQQDQAAVLLKVTTPGFGDWHRDATCTIRPESLIAERYVDCSPGSASAPALALIRRGPGAGSHLLPINRTSSPIDPDIVQDISTEPVRDALATILDELGTGLAARGADLNAVILRADPGLAATDRVFRLLAAQRRTLAQLAGDSETVLAPLARARASLARFVTGASVTAAASATRSAAIATSIRDLPPFLQQLKPLMADLGNLAEEGTPALSNLGHSASSLDDEFTELVPFATKARTALTDLATAASQSQSNLVSTRPLAVQLAHLGSAAVPASRSLASLTASLTRTGAITQLMALLFNGAAATNGYDADGHYLRTDLIVGSCTAYARTAVPGCSANFAGNPGGSSSVRTAVADAARAGVGDGAGGSAAASARSDALTGLLGYLTGDGK